MVDSIQTNIFGRQQGIETELNDQRAKVQEIETVVVKQVTNANKTVENELNRFEKIMSAFEKYLESQLGDVRQSMQQQTEDQKNARGENFADFVRKQDEMQGTVNVLAQNLSKIEEDAKDRAQLVRDELKVVESGLTQQFQELQNKIAGDDSTLQQRVQIAFDKTNFKFKE